MTLLPIGAAFGLPVFALGVRRYTHPDNRSFAFTVFYAVLCISSAFGGLLITFARAHFHDGLDLPWPLSMHLSWMRVNVLLCSACTGYTCAASCFVRNLRVEKGVPLEAARLEPMPRSTASCSDFMKVVYGSRPFWKLLAISLIVALGTRATFRHLDATFPKYFMRMWGEDAPFEIFVAVEPIMTVLLSFPVTFVLLRRRISTSDALIYGTLLQSFCPVALMYTSYGATFLFVAIMALGEAIWSPRLYEYSTMVAPEGFEGTFVAVAFVPQYVSAGVVGVTSGYLLDTYVPDPATLEPGEVMRPAMLWGMVAAASLVTPLVLSLVKDRLFGDEPTLPNAPPVVTHRASNAGSGRGRYAMALPAADPDDAREDILE